jgi:hypothetical protein
LRTPSRLQSGQDFCFHFWCYSWPAKLLALRLGPSKAGAHPLLNDRAFELGKDTKHLKHGLTARRRRVDTLLMQEQVHATGMDLGRKPTRSCRLRPGRSTDQARRLLAALFNSSLHRLRFRFHHVMVMVMIMVMNDHHVVLSHHVRLSHFFHGHFRILRKGWDSEAE